MRLPCIYTYAVLQEQSLVTKRLVNFPRKRVIYQVKEL